ncbi:ACP S-malonyltransferase [Streptomyces oceani]|uniref:Malonyl CoA-acyl carrier protein transacylase n=1 Tax=Streptomyces oceani TaxID=1075402 RepID=A0A1E7KFA8_9ACTN|nr:ACP S-malonyltransferase [Streptomyces oceani]OEV02610.1 ACP S-malonyltransferase [Streptomyces oceani]
MLVLVAPGQGAQKPGFLTPWLDLPGVADRIREWSEAIDLDLIYYGTEGTAEEIVDTAVAQPLLVASALVSTTALLEDHEPTQIVGLTAGHSVGELPASVTAGVLSAEAAMSLVRTRGRAMAKAAAASGTGMSAVLGGDSETVTEHLAKLGLTAANVNGAGQIVAAGTLEQLAALNDDKPPEARVRPLKVAGAFHTEHMAPAVADLETAIKEVTTRNPVIPFVSNRDGEVVSSGAEVAERLIGQVASPVRWDLCMETFQNREASTVIEVCPGGTLTGLAKRAMSGVRTLALKSPADLDKARALVAEHAESAEQGV